MKKPLIICVVGESGVGKSHLANYVSKELSIPQIPSYTTRPKRKDEEVVSTHIHISKEEFSNIRISDMIAYTEWYGNMYCCTVDQVEKENLYVIDEYGLKYIKDTFPDDFCIKSIRLWAYDDVRLERTNGDIERVNRDKGKFSMLKPDFDFSICTNGDTISNEIEFKNVCKLILRDYYGSSK